MAKEEGEDKTRFSNAAAYSHNRRLKTSVQGYKTKTVFPGEKMKTLAIFGMLSLAIVAKAVAAETETREAAPSPRRIVQETPATVEKVAEKILKSLESRYAEVNTVKCPFKQTTVDQTFGEKIESRGVFYLKKPNRLRIEYAPPQATTVLIAEGYTYRYIPKLKQVERFRIDETNPVIQTNYMLLGFGAATEDVLRVYNASVRDGENASDSPTKWIVLTPRHPRDVAFKSIEMLVNTERSVPMEFRVTQLDGTQALVKLELDDLTLDAPLDEKLFRPSFPSDAQIVDMR